MVQFAKLRLSGFKSFVDNTELVIETGLTGVVGPNGCGKSNLVEALKWVMGETSAKQMRGGGMEDVIFNGTSSRTPRNVAEVTVKLDNRARKAPAMFNDAEELEVSRRIERGAGSNYKVNGKDVRARDVQLLFADSATGARSTALVSQGRIGAIIAAKPAQRRTLLEEAAGITGLHSRRHEAELRLRGAESNLARLEDVLITMDAQMNSLRKQARQATRYRNISGHVRTAEATLLAFRWEEALERMDRARVAFQDADAKVIELTKVTALAVKSQTEAAAILPALRTAEVEAAAELQHYNVTRDGLEAEEKRISDAQQDLNQRLTQIQGDFEREQRLDREADTFIERLQHENQELNQAQDGEVQAREATEGAVNEVAQAVAARETALNTLTEELAAAQAQRNNLDRRVTETQVRQDRFSQRVEEAREQRETLVAQAVPTAATDDADNTVTAAQAGAEAAHTAVETAGGERTKAGQVVEDAVTQTRSAEAVLTRLEAEVAALAEVLESGSGEGWPPLIDSVTVEPGFEAALGVSLGEDLSAAGDEAAPVHWRTLLAYSQSQPLPAGAEPLGRYVRGAPALVRRLSQVGVVEDTDAGAGLADGLLPGQRLVSRDGGLWRWDGFTVAAGAPTAAAVRLQQSNRLRELRDGLEGAGAALAKTEATLEAARGAETKIIEDDRAAREAMRAADRALTQAREAQAELSQKVNAHSSRLASLDESIERLDGDLAESRTALDQAKALQSELPDPSARREEAGDLRSELAVQRAELVQRQSAHAQLVRDADQRGQRLGAVNSELASWAERKAAAARQVETLTNRGNATRLELTRLADRPARIAEQRNGLLDQITQAEEKRRLAAEALAQAEGGMRDIDHELRAVEGTLAQARENRVRTEGEVTQGKQTCRELAERIHEKLECKPEQVREAANLGDDDPLPPVDQIEKRLERLVREREGMGAINLRAEAEAVELTEQIEGLNNERSDLINAIEKLRRAIAELNREGRQRLVASFKEVDQHFQELFVRLFGGGRAHLELTESDDPLEAGLEIMASPPGKRMQVLSLLSGGEQALTALALMFAVFLTNPAPICVLDEVDAPLDDANVDRFCTMLDEMASGGDTRFLVITHHRMTMARMHRLFGVTMSERGISQLVSVDLQRAAELRATG